MMEKEIIDAFHEKPLDVPVIGITGGKGGVGKTTVAVNLVEAFIQRGYRVSLADADVDAPNAAMLFGIPLENPVDVTITQPLINEKCTKCGECVRACRMNALFQSKDGKPIILGDCNGCEACILVCPEEAIDRGKKAVGRTFRTDAGNVSLFTGELLPGEAESSFVVSAVKDRMFKESGGSDLIIVDTSPGTHCNVINALKGADIAYAVTEPTPLGVHDLELILTLLDIMELEASVVLNLSDLPGVKGEISRIAKAHNTDVPVKIPLDEALARSYAEGVPVVRKAPGAVSSKRITQMADTIEKRYLS